jgi:anti-sigma-K factor RskA
MDIRQYIASGTLELYVMGVLLPEEMEEVSNMSLKYPEIKTEIEKIEMMMEQYASAHGKELRPEIKSSILQKLKEAPAPLTIIKTERKTTEEFSFTQLMVAASIALLLIGNIFFFYKWQASQNDLGSLISQNYQLAQGYNTFKTKYQQVNDDMKVMSDEAIKKITLKGMPKTPSALAMVYWNEKTKEIYIEVKNLPMPEEGKQYQLWALMDGKPIDAGIFEMDSTENTLQKVKNIQAAQAFAVTLEQKGGSSTPTMNEMYLLAKL